MCYIVNCVHTKRVWTCIIKGFMIDNKKQDCKNLSNTWSNTFEHLWTGRNEIKWTKYVVRKQL